MAFSTDMLSNICDVSLFNNCLDFADGKDCNAASHLVFVFHSNRPIMFTTAPTIAEDYSEVYLFNISQLRKQISRSG